MKRFPLADPGEPDCRSANRYLLWLAGRQWPSVALGAGWGVIWMVCLSLLPAVIGRAVGSGIATHDSAALLRWSLIALLLSLSVTVAGVFRHRNSMANIYAADFRTIQVVTRQIPRLGASLPLLTSGGEVVTIGAADIDSITAGFQNLPIAAGAVAAVIVVAAIMFTASIPLGLVVVIGVPLLMAGTAVLTRALKIQQTRYRNLQADLTTQATDIATGLRVLRGIGGEQVFADRYRRLSQDVRLTGNRIARIEAGFDAGQVFAPGLLAVGVTWLAATFAVRHQISVGAMVAFYGYATFLTLPLSILVQVVNVMTGAHVSAGRIAGFLRLEPVIDDRRAGTPAALDSAAAPATAPVLADDESGLVVPPSGLLAVVCTRAGDAERLGERLARFADTGRPSLGGVPLSELPRFELRRRILLVRNEDRLFRGRLRTVLTPPGAEARPDVLARAIHTAAAEDIVDQLPDGLDEVLPDGARNLSSGQQQRLRLARALAAEPERMILIEPTNLLDAHTEALVAERLVAHRAGRSSVLFAASSVLLDRADCVALVVDGRVTALGSHRHLQAESPVYRAVVDRGEA